jgi:Holliday junction resolvase RusA-like endonuclease
MRRLPPHRTSPNTLSDGTETMKFELLGDPIPKRRPRSFIKRGRIEVCDPQEQQKRATKTLLKIKLNKALSDPETAEEASNLMKAGAYEVSFKFGMPKPKAMKDPWNITLHTTNCDLDNLEKFYCDCANGVLYQDDRQIVSLRSTKYYADTPKTILEIKAIAPMTLEPKAKAILDIFGPEKAYQLVHVAKSLLTWFAGVKDDVFQENESPFKQEQLHYIASVLSKMADEFGPELKKIQQKYPGFWKESGVYPQPKK